MRSVYAVQFEIVPGDIETAVSTFAEIQSRLAGWVQQKYRRAFQADLDFEFHGRVIHPLEDHDIVATYREASESQFSSLLWTHPADKDPSLLWCIDFAIARKLREVQVSLVIRVSSRQPVVKPLNFDLGRPRIVADIVNHYPCSIGGHRIARSPSVVGIEGVANFVRDHLCDPERLLPSIVLSPHLVSEKTIVDPILMQDALLGYASVHVLESKWVGFAFTDRIGRDYACYNGAARLYWPGFQDGANPWDHPLYLPDKIYRLEAEDRPIQKYLFRMMASIASFRFREGRIIDDARASIKRQDDMETDILRGQLKGGLADYELVAKGLETAWDQIARLTKENERLGSRTAELEDEVEQTKLNLASVWEFNSREEASPKEASAHPEATREFKDVSEAITVAEQDFRNELDIWESAKKAAEDSHYRRPLDIYQALMAIADLCKAIRESKKSKKKVGRWEDHFKKTGLKYAASESQTTLSMYGESRTFTNRGGTCQMLKHLTIGGGSAIDCVQIYFELDGRSDCIAVGYCGVHLPHSKQRG